MTAKTGLILLITCLLAGCMPTIEPGCTFKTSRLTKIVKETEGLEIEAVPFVDEEVDFGVPSCWLLLPQADPGERFLYFTRNARGTCIYGGVALISEAHQTALFGGVPTVFCSCGFGPGEIIEHYLISEDMQRGAMIRLVPQPIEAESLCGYKMSAEFVPPTRRYVYSILATGFDPNEEVAIETHGSGCSNPTSILVLAGVDGSIQHIARPRPSELCGGTDVVRVTGRKGSISVDIPWGTVFVRRFQEIKEAERAALEGD